MISQYMNLVIKDKNGWLKLKDYDIICANTSGNGLYEDTFVANKTIHEDKIPSNPIPYYNYTEKDPLEFQLTLYWEYGFDEDGLQLVKQMLNKDNYFEFYFEEYEIKHYFGQLSSSSKLTHNGNGEGFASINIRCNSPFAYSPATNVFYDIQDSEEIILNNKGNEPLRPYIEIKKVGDGSLSITNISNQGLMCTIDNLKDGETIILDNDNEDIESDLDNTYHFDDHNDVFVECVVGKNRLLIEGSCKMQLYYRYIYD